jgi:catechol 2,3-dioxygenase-like lactoylglutathione lyase family enzyme
MASTDVAGGTATQTPEVGAIDMKLEVVTVPVSDVDRAKRFYQSLGWRLDVDLGSDDAVRVVQFTPPHSGCSIHIGKGLTSAPPGSAERMLLAVEDIDAARQDLIERGIDVSEVDVQEPPPGLGATGRSYFAYAAFKDPDGNAWLLQEITTRIPGREWED